MRGRRGTTLALASVVACGGANDPDALDDGHEPGSTGAAASTGGDAGDSGSAGEDDVTGADDGSAGESAQPDAGGDDPVFAHLATYLSSRCSILACPKDSTRQITQ